MAGDKRLPVTVVVGAIDNVTYKVMGINEKLKKITAPIGRVRSAFSLLGEESGLGKLSTSLGKVGKTGQELFSGVAETVMKVGAVSLAAAGAVFGLTKAFSDAGDDIALVSRQLGLTSTSYQELAYAANQANVPQELFNSSMLKFSKGIGEASAGTGEALIGFSALGIGIRDSHGKLKTLEALLPEVADKLGDVKNQNLRNAIAAKLFGKEGAKLNDIFKGGSAELTRMRKEANDVGAVMSPEQIKAASEFDEGMKSITATILMVRNVIGSALAPVIIDLGKKLQTFILAHRPEIEQFAAAFASKLPSVLADLAGKFQAIGTFIAPLVSLVGFLTDHFGGLNVALGGLFIWFGGFGLLGSLLKFAGALSGVVVPALQVGLGLFSLLFSIVQGLTVGFVALVGWPVALGAALIAAGVAVYKYWGPILEMFNKIGGVVSGFFGGTSPVAGGPTAALAAPMLGPALGFSKTVDASLRNPPVQQSESSIKVDFTNLPKGARVETEKAAAVPLDVYMGFSMGF